MKVIQSFDLPPFICPECGTVMEQATPPDGGRGPQENDYALCMVCAAILIFKADMSVRSATEVERANAPPEISEVAKYVRRAVARPKAN